MMIEEWNDTPWRYAPHTQDHDSQWVELIPNFQRSIYISCNGVVSKFLSKLIYSEQATNFQIINHFGLGRLEK